MTRLNITLPDQIATELKNIPNKSKFIAEALAKELKEQKQRELDKRLREGYQKTKKEDASLGAEWEEATLENWSAQ